MVFWSWTCVPSPTSKSQKLSRTRNAVHDALRQGDGLHAPEPRTVTSKSHPLLNVSGPSAASMSAPRASYWAPAPKTPAAAPLVLASSTSIGAWGRLWRDGGTCGVG